MNARRVALSVKIAQCRDLLISGGAFQVANRPFEDRRCMNLRAEIDV